MTGPLGALPALSPTARRALIGCALLAAADAVALVIAAWSLATSLARQDHLPIFAIAVAARALLAWASRTVAARAAAGTKADLRAHLLDTATRRGPEWIDQRHPAELTTLATHGLDALDDYFTRFLPALVGAAVTVPLVGLAILLTDWRSAVLIAITVPLIPLFAALIGRFTQARIAADAAGRLASQLVELIRALPVLVAFNRAEAQTRAVHDASERHRIATRSTLRIAFLSAFVLDVLATLSVGLVAVDIGLRLLHADLGLATALLVLILAPECYLPLRAAGAAYHASEDGMAAVRGVADIVGAEGDPVPEGVRPAHLRHQLDLARGRITRLDGPSGSGKSTTIAAILGFTHRTTAPITVPRTEIAWIPQHPRLTGPSVADELRRAVTDLGSPTDTELTEAATAAVAEHLLGRGVHDLSAGERQRVAVARALLRLRKGAWLLLADEPTAHVDPPTAARLMSAIDDAASEGAAVLLATHTHPTAALTATPATSVPTTIAARQAETQAPLRNLVDRRLVAGALLGALALGSAIALTATAAWLIARAAQHPSIVVLSVAIVAVRAFGLAKGTLRYAERLVTHDSAFRLAGRLRVDLWRSLVRIGPARTAKLRRTDGLRRLVDDTDTVRDLVPRVLTPPLIAAIVAAGAITLQSILRPTAGLVLAVAILVAGLAGPIL
ncbi:MAG TPA: ABC transporter transmembrane domain-containing protein, partial [Pseudonocardiaceae bacterium]